MIKFGITAASQAAGWNRTWRRGLVAASLLRDGEPSDLVSHAMFDRVLQGICLSNGVIRTTRRNRFRDLDGWVSTLLARHYASDAPLTVADFAVSSGITAAEWYTGLAPQFPRMRFEASDNTLFLVAATRRRAGDTFIVEPAGTPIQYVREPFVVSLVQQQHWLYPINRLLRLHAISIWQQLASDHAGELEYPGDWYDVTQVVSPLVRTHVELQRILLLHPEVLALQSHAFRVRHHSIFEQYGTPLDVVRSMNVLNTSYFDPEQLRSATRALHASVKPRGLWLVGRSRDEDNGEHDVSVLERESSGWRVVARHGAGSEIERFL